MRRGLICSTLFALALLALATGPRAAADSVATWDGTDSVTDRKGLACELYKGTCLTDRCYTQKTTYKSVNYDGYQRIEVYSYGYCKTPHTPTGHEVCPEHRALPCAKVQLYQATSGQEPTASCSYPGLSRMVYITNACQTPNPTP